MTGSELIAFTRQFYPQWRRDTEQALVKAFELPLDVPVRQTSKGTRTKLALVLAFSRGADLLILDEPSEGLDPVMIETMLQAVVRAATDGTTVFFSSHQLSEAERIADRVFILNRGALALEGPLDELREQYRRINVVFAMDPPPGIAFQALSHVRRSGNLLTALTKTRADAIAAEMKALGAVAIDVQPVSLRELFFESIGATEDVA
jgi:ABC-2 type transport system ATP-binding protein